MISLLGRTSLALAIAALVGCGDSGTGPGGGALGTGSGQVSGSVNQSFSGLAVFGRDNSFGTNAFVIVIADDDAEIDAGVVLLTGGRPGPGTYSLGSPDTDRYGEIGIGPDLYESVSGQLTISASSAQRVQGTMTFTARRLGGQAQVNVSAQFNAMCLPTGPVSCD